MSKVLDELIPVYYDNKTQYDDLKKVVDTQNATIKQVFNEGGINSTSYTVNGLVAECTTSYRDNVNMEQLLQVLLSHKDDIPVTVVKTVQVVDEEALEQALYHDAIPESIKKEIAACNTPKEIVTLKVKPIKTSKKKILNE